MNPIFIILYAVIVTLILTLAFPRLRQASPAGKRWIRMALLIGGLALIITLIASRVLAG